jgi:DNA helicase-2/ATP-dependent DNA helicase PcrA
MSRSLTIEEQGLVAEEQGLVERLAGTGVAPYFARLRVRTRAGGREVLLGSRARVDEVAAVVDWQTAPLAGVFFAHQVGDEYELEHDGRVLQGTVVRRHLVEFRGEALVGLRWIDRRLWRQGDGSWWAEDGGVGLQPRASALQRRPLSPTAAALDDVQRSAVELPGERSLLVLGEAGFGKTTVALHRLARLARAAEAEGRRFRALVIVPTPGLQRLVRRSLAELGVTAATVETFAGWVAAQAWRVFPELPRRIAGSAGPEILRLKRHPALRVVFGEIVAGTPAMREVRAGYRDRRETIRELLLHLYGDRLLMQRVVAAADGELGEEVIAELLAHTRAQFSPTTEHALAHVDRERLRTLDGRALDEGTPMAAAETIDAEDFAVVFALHRRISGVDATRHGALARYQHVLLDEAQELAPIELELIGRAVAGDGSVTVAGDGHQQVDASASFRGWAAALAELGQEGFATVTLARSYRCPPAIEVLAREVVEGVAGEVRAVAEASVAGRVMDGVASELGAEVPVLVTRYEQRCHLVSELGEALAGLSLADPRVHVAVVCRHEETARWMAEQLGRALPVRLVLDGDFRFAPGVEVTCVREVKGLEFDLVVVPDLDAANYPDTPAARRALYVALTRPLHQLWLATAGSWSALLPARLRG